MRVVQTSFRTWRVYDDYKFYFVFFDDKGFHCNCDEYVLQNTECKHIKLVKKHIHFKELRKNEKS